MNDRRLRDDIRDAYLTKEPSPATLERLMAMEATVQRRSWPAIPYPGRTWLSAAALALCAAGLWFALAGRDSGGARAIAGEIAMNHNKRLDVEFETASYVDLRRAMDRLDFSLVEPERMGKDGFRLVGARYCSIQGQLAAQLRLETDDGEHLTLYQTALADDLEELGSTRLRSGGLTIDLWHEGGIFLGMARGP